jgi:4-hydroxybenzoate polyprenyltransferase
MVNMGKHKIHFSSFLIAGLRLVRIPNLLILVLNALVVYLYLVQPTPDWHGLLHLKIWLLTIAVVFTAAAGYVINDYYDIKIDYVNKPKRVVVGRIIARRTAIILHTALNFIAVVLAILVSWKVCVSVFLSSALLWYYANSLKRKPLIGNLVVAFLAGFSVYIMGLLREDESKLILLFSLFAFMISLIRELIKDMEDIKGDAAHGCKTLPILIGEPKTKAVVLFFVAILMVMVGVWFYPQSNELAIFSAVVLFPLMIMLVIGLVVAKNAHQYRRISSLCKWIMLAGILSIPLF